jgi:hypothetical protein
MRLQGTVVEGPRGANVQTARRFDATGYPVGAGAGDPKGRSPLPLSG